MVTFWITSKFFHVINKKKSLPGRTAHVINEKILPSLLSYYLLRVNKYNRVKNRPVLFVFVLFYFLLTTFRLHEQEQVNVLSVESVEFKVHNL